MFKKLFTINYKNKQFLILVDENHRKTFLEISQDGKYVYPEYEDFYELNEIYNNYDYTVKYNNLSKFLSFSEKIRYKSVILALSALLTIEAGYVGTLYFRVDKDLGGISLGFQRLYKNENRNRSQIDTFFDNEIITYDDVVRVINDNQYMDDFYKKKALEVLDLNLELDPQANLRIYYENMRELNVIIDDEDTMSEGNTVNQVGYFISSLKEIHLSKEHAKDDWVVLHEFTHAFHNLLDASKDEVLYINETRGFSLDEAMTNKIISNKIHKVNSYGIQYKLLLFFIDNVDDFNYQIYNSKGIVALIDELKEKYPKIDIDYLIDYLDTYTKTSYKIGNTQEKPFENEDFCSELFNIAINNIDKDDMYSSFDTFIEVFNEYTDSEYYNKYYKLYNQELLKLGLINQQEFNIKQINQICLIDGKFYFGTLDKEYFDYDGNKLSIEDEKNVIYLPLAASLKEEIFNKNEDNISIYSSKMIDSIISNDKYVDINYVKYNSELSDEDKKTIIDSIFELKIANIDKNNLYDGFNTITRYLNFGMYDQINNYLNKYDQKLIDLGYVTREQIDFARSIKGFIVNNDKYYTITDKIGYSNYAYTISEMSSNVASHTKIFSLGNLLEYECLDEYGNKKNVRFNDEVIDFYAVDSVKADDIIQYIYDNKIDDLYSEDFIKKMDMKFKFIKYNKFLDLISDQAYVEFGYDKNNQLVVRLNDGGKVISGESVEFASKTAKIPFNVYAKISKYMDKEYNSLDEIISLEYINSIPVNLLKYYAPNTLVGEINSYYLNEFGNQVVNTEREYSFIETPQIIIDGVKGEIRSVYVFQDNKGNLVVHFMDGDNIPILNITNLNLQGRYFEFLEKYISYYGLVPDDDNVYRFSKSNIIKLINQYIDDVFIDRVDSIKTESNINSR